MNEQEYFGNIGGAYEEEQAERLKECTVLLAEKTGISLEEAAAAISNVLHPRPIHRAEIPGGNQAGNL